MAVSRQTEIYLVRHGETEWNAAGRFQGKLDSRLTDKGVAQAGACGRRLSAMGTEFETLFASPLGRARETAAIIKSFGISPEVQCDDRIAEVSIGSWDGLTHVDIDAQWPGLLDDTTPFDWFFRSPDGESYDAANARVTQWLNDLQGVTLAVSHGLIGRLIRGTYLGMTRDDALGLPVPQDVIWQLSKGRIESIPT
ncbi:MAG: histidine phosphatase family protein [Candidatus Sphingomonas phytovorans]|nr:histidine phosphatase family protein [Sphingomonas sp.]WEK02171.1 MAG: histidine phosphatase family protein [Sphingomonas sp.]